MKRLAPGVAGTHVLLAALLLSGCAPDGARSDRVNAAYLAIVAAEDARPTEGPALDLLIRSADEDNVFVRRAAIRALGRLERPAHAGIIAEALDDPSPSVRAMAANALAQAYHTSDGNAALEPLLARVEVENEAEVLGALAQSIGRLRLDAAHGAEGVDVLVDLSEIDGTNAPLPVMVGVALGLEARARLADLGPRAARRLVAMTRYGSVRPFDLGPGRVRTLAMAALGHEGLMTLTISGRASTQLCCDFCQHSAARNYLQLFRVEVPGSNGRRYFYVSLCRDTEGCNLRRLNDEPLRALLARVLS